MTKKPHHHRLDEVKKKLSIKVFGIGAAGAAVLEQMIKTGFPRVAFAVVRTDAAALARSSAPEKFHVDAGLLRGRGTGNEVERARAAIEGQLPKLRAACEGVDVIFIVAGLGGKTGTLLGPVLAQVAKEAGALVLTFATLPFDCEGSRRQKQARHGLELLKEAADGVICLPNQRIFKLIDAKTSLLDTFKTSNELLADGVRGIWRLLTYTALIEIHFADLCAIVRERHGESAFAVAEANGPDRAREVMEKLLTHPMLDGGQMLAAADTVLVSLMGGPDLTTTEVNAVMEQINRQCENAHVIMGAAIDAEFKDRLAVIVIATRGESIEAEEPTGPASRQVGRGPTNATNGFARAQTPGHEDQFLNSVPTARPTSRFVPPPPAMTPEKLEQFMARQNGTAGRPRKNASKMSQGQLPLEIISKGRFDKSEPTIHKGEDLDVPTYIRRGVALN